MKEFFKRALPYLISVLVGIVIFIILICTRKIWNAAGTREVMGILSDACFVPGVILAGVGLLIFASNGGAFHMLGYAMVKIADLFRRDYSARKYKDFYEYREAKKDKKHRMGFMLITGIVFIAFAGIFLIVYSQLK